MNNYNQQEFSDYTVVDSHQVSGTGVVARECILNCVNPPCVSCLPPRGQAGHTG